MTIALIILTLFIVFGVYAVKKDNQEWERDKVKFDQSFEEEKSKPITAVIVRYNNGDTYKKYFYPESSGYGGMYSYIITSKDLAERYLKESGKNNGFMTSGEFIPMGNVQGVYIKQTKNPKDACTCCKRTELSVCENVAWESNEEIINNMKRPGNV